MSLDIPGLDAALAELAAALGTPAGCRMEAELRALPVYGPGQFFVSHTDTEKNDTMIGTLTVTLPSLPGCRSSRPGTALRATDSRRPGPRSPGP